ncbi:DUF192 domain-containing protein [Streptomyces sp. H27-C3]|uniref:DUF192 domain-containing protein n=1 Tax=Streptomyces sp. H27-C3 TaxID=3046305 RepID=UPI0024B8E737|nr:DUF192 domain-containing protein [Streptomyces sp. H27-C3]MDJ0466536.1 DUF192 domain-containing protein [Streptomyces sp. H27-C3]
MGQWRDGAATLTVEGREGSPLPLEIAASARARTRGLLDRDGIVGAMLLSPASCVHTVRMRFAIDVAYLDRELRVIGVRTMRPGRLGMPRPRARHVLEAEAGALLRWGLRRGVRVAVLAGPAGAAGPS